MKKVTCLKYIYSHITQMHAVWLVVHNVTIYYHYIITIPPEHYIYDPAITVIVMEQLGKITKSLKCIVI